MTLWFVPVWALPTAILSVALIGVLLVIVRTHHGLKHRVGTLTPYTETHANELQRRVRRIVTASAEQREAITRSLTHSDELSVEARAMQAVLDAEREGKGNADTARHTR